MLPELPALLTLARLLDMLPGARLTPLALPMFLILLMLLMLPAL
jgi:hypothetical protein